MATASSISAFDNRSSLRHGQPPRSSPHTPQQSQSAISSFASSSSPGSSLRNDEDAIIFEIGSRWLRAGFEGDSTPICTVGFGPEESRRVGDYRGWLRSSSQTVRQLQAMDPETWARAYELWRMDLRDLDLGLVEDKIERVFRETYNKYLLTDAGTSRLVLVLPSLMPHPLLSSVLSTLFSRWRFPSITLLPTASMATAAAGLRAALVVDLGWAETTVTGVYEYREIAAKRSTRAMKLLMQEMGKFLTDLASSKDTRESASVDGISVSFEFCEEAVSRFAWCTQRGKEQPPSESEHLITKKMVSIPNPSNPSADYVEVPFGSFADPVEKALFAKHVAECELDDQEKPIPQLVYNTLLTLPPDVRGACMSRVVFVGGGANIPGVRRRILQEVGSFVEKYGWSQVRGKVIDQQRQKLQNLSLNREQPQQTPPPIPSEENTTTINTTTSEQQPTPSPTPSPGTDTPVTPQREPEEELDFVEQKLRRTNKDKDSKPYVHGILREVESLGAWAGASLVTSLKIRGLVEIDREKYLQHGLAGATRDSDSHAHVPDRRSGLRSGGDRSSWTLAGWG